MGNPKSSLLWQLPLGSLLLVFLISLFNLSSAPLVMAAPSSAALAGSFQDELGCPGDWQPECAASELGDAGNGVWRAVYNIPAGSWEYKVALNDSWDVSYPAGNVSLSVPAAQDVRFYYDDKTAAVMDSVNVAQIPVAAGSFQSELGCPGDWQPDCVQSLLTDPDGDGVFAFQTSGLPAGDYFFKVAFNEGWGNGEVPASDVPFTINTTTEVLTINWTATTDAVSFTVEEPAPPSVTAALAGSFQSELGCPGDWQPECALTELVDQGNDVFRGEFSLPVGNWEYKVALNDSWDVSFPAGNVLLNVVAAQNVRFYYDHKTNAVMDNVNYTRIPVAAGSFQDEIGCPGDWQPQCVQSLLTDPDGDGLFTFVTEAIPAGDYAFKVAFNEGWGNGEVPAGDVPFTVDQPGRTVTIGWNAATDEVTVAVGTPTIEPGDEELVRDPVRAAAQEEIFYFVLPDRFEDGDPSNNEGGAPGGSLAETGFKVDDKAFYHGGDFAGLRSRLDYLQGLGVTALWITPPFENLATQPDSSTAFGIGAAYHGYWILDYENADPHLGTNAELQALIADAQARGMKVYFDIVVNHTADVIQYAEGSDAYISKADQPYLDASGSPFDDREFANDPAFPPLDPAVSFPYTPVFENPGDETLKNPAWLNNPIYYHNRGNSTFSGENSLYGDFFGLDDLFTEHPDVVAGYIDIFKNVIDTYDVDGFRLDTVKHVNDELWQALAPEIMAYAAAQGKTDFYMFGEVFDGSPAFLSHYTTAVPLPSVLDFGLQGQAVGFAAYSSGTDSLRDFFAQDDYYTDVDSSAYGLANFISNHDIGRIGKAIQDGNPGAADSEMVARSQLGHALMFFSRGFPVVYYGDEQGFTGDGGDKDARENMMPSQVAVYNDNNLIGTSATTADSNFDTSHVLYQTLADFAQLRAAHPALTYGAQIHRFSEGGAGVYAFSRIERGEQVEYLVALNNAETGEQATFTTYSPDTTFAEIYPGSGSIVSDPSGVVTIDVPALGIVIYQAGSPIPAGSGPIGVSMSSPAAGSEVLGRVEVAANLSADQLAEVTFAVKVGTGDYEPVGVDTNAPYRILYDVSDLAPGTEVSFKAIVNDLAGNLSSASVTAVVGEDAPPPPTGDAAYAIIHYFREDGDYGDHTTGNYNDFWGLHLWGEAIDPSEVTEWTSPKPFLGEDEYGRFAWIKLADPSKPLNFIVHRGDVKDGTDADRFYNPGVNPEVWLKQGDPNNYSSQAEAQGYVTIRYQRPDGDYGTPSADYNTFWGLHLWGDAIDPSEGTEWTSPKPPTGIDDYGAYWDILILDANQPVNFIIHRGDEKDPGPDQSMIPAEDATIWIQSGDETIYPSRGAAENTVYLRYHRADGDYGDPTSSDFNDFWGMHVWEGALSPNPAWQQPVLPTSFDIFGPLFVVPLQPNASQLAYILHRGDTKDPGPDQFLNLDKWGYEVWQLEGVGPNPDEPHYVLPVLGEPGANTGSINEERAYWVDESTIAWSGAADSSLTYTLNYAPEGGLETSETGITGGEALMLTQGALSDDVKAKFPHLAALPALKIAEADLPLVAEILKGQIAVAAVDGDGQAAGATGLQIPGVLDDLYTYDGELGVVWGSEGDRWTPTLKVWAPTAKSVTLHLFDDSDLASSGTTYPMTWDADSGVWSVTGERSWKWKFYLYEVEVYVHNTGQVERNLVTDPYSLSLSMNSLRSQIVDLNDRALKPRGWNGLVKPPLNAPEDISIYELHVRDFSIFDETVAEIDRGTFKAFTYDGNRRRPGPSDGMAHLLALQEAGLTHIHLLPAFDIATIDEDKSARIEPDYDLLASLPPNSEEQQAIINLIRDQDGFNWGYDPFHYGLPEGSYSTDPDGPQRIVEFREMVQVLNQNDLRVIMDVVYNHTSASGQSEKSVLDRIVPGYYHRLNDSGAVEKSTCCENTATEHNMMEKLMVDTVLLWATEYKVDAFRFDLMGHHMKEDMLNLRAALDSLTLAEDGVDGSKIYLYGEGWNFGEVANNARGVNATQLNMFGTGIGTFSDRARDAVRGAGPFDSGAALQNQGFASGLCYDPNAYTQGNPDACDRLALLQDQIKVEMAGNLADYEIVDRFGNLVKGSQVDYNGQPAGYTADPQELISYVSKHDNQTLYDIYVYGLPAGTSMEDRLRAQQVAVSTVMLGQGVPFVHAGVDMLRSKSLDRNSYNSGDWFNRLDFTYQTNNFGVGLPPAEGGQSDNWPLMSPLLANPALKPAPVDIDHSAEWFREWLEIRYSSKLFRLETAEDIMARVTFYNNGPTQIPGLIAMGLSDEVDGLPDIDKNYKQIMVVINANDELQRLMVPELANERWVLHVVQRSSVDADVRGAFALSSRGEFIVPGRTTAVFVVQERYPRLVWRFTRPEPQ